MNETNWSTQQTSSTVTKADRDALEKAHKQEAMLEKKGYRWITINPKTQVFAECDKNGNLTEKGKIQVDKIKRVLYQYVK